MNINRSIKPHPRIGYVGRIIWKDLISYTVVSQSGDERIAVWNPDKKELIAFDNQETFLNWAYGEPVPCGLGTKGDRG